MSSKRADGAALKALTAREWAVLLGAAVSLPVSFALLKTLGYGRTVRIGTRCSGHRPAPSDADERATVATRMTWVVNERLHLPSTCLSRSLALWWLLRIQGVPTEIRIGVRPNGDVPLDAHAWVEHEGRVLNEFDDVNERYAAFPPDPRSR